MTISDDNRRQFELIGEDQLALALATGTLQSLGMTEDKKQEALEWIAERRTKRDTERQIEDTRSKFMRRWTIVAAIASVIAAVASVAGLFR
jgi:hypothetical protein